MLTVPCDVPLNVCKCPKKKVPEKPTTIKKTKLAAATTKQSGLEPSMTKVGPLDQEKAAGTETTTKSKQAPQVTATTPKKQQQKRKSQASKKKRQSDKKKNIGVKRPKKTHPMVTRQKAQPYGGHTHCKGIIHE